MQAPSPITKPARVRVERARGTRRVILLGDKATHRAEAGEDQRDDRSLRAAGEDHVRLAPPDRLGRLADRGGTRGAGGDRGEVLASETELDRDLAARRVDEHRGDEERRDAIGSPLGEDHLLLGNRRDPSDRRPDEDPGSCAIDVLEPGVVPRLLRGRDREQDVPVHAPRLLGRHQVSDLEAGDLGRDPYGIFRRVEGLDPADATAAGDGRVPRRRRVEPDWRDRPEPRDDHPSHRIRRLLGGTVWPCRARRSRTSEPVERPADLDPAIPFPPMEAELVRELPEGDEWQYEPKWDGFRGLLENGSGELRLWSRNARPLLRYFPELAPLGDLLPPAIVPRRRDRDRP